MLGDRATILKPTAIHLTLIIRLIMRLYSTNLTLLIKTRSSVLSIAILTYFSERGSNSRENE